jgi:type IV secretory pathway ATPase VirB11/archaellum biosynthesis ATPase
MNLTQTGHYSDAAALSESDVAQLAQRLEEDDYETPFAALDDWHLLRSIAFQRPDLVKPYLYLLDLEAFDES